jgi:hypothetical protein
MVDLALSSLDSSLRQPKAVVSQMPAPGADLPRQLTSFVGRELEISEVERLMETSRLTTLTGAGGVGKTRLALQVVVEFQRTHAEDVVVVELASLASPSLVSQLVAATLGMGQQAQQPDLAVLANAIGVRRLLLVLDSCEHLLLACFDLVDRLLRKCAVVRCSKRLSPFSGHWAIACLRPNISCYWPTSHSDRAVLTRRGDMFGRA